MQSYRVHYGEKGTETIRKGMAGERSWLITFSSIQEAHKENRKWGEVIKTSKLTQ